ncbi:MAG: SLC13 family permease [Paracoccaceae bacterium]
MTDEQIYILLILLAAMAMFLWGKWRHDMVALGALLASVIVGVTPPEGAFAGFGHPAVITVAAVLVLSRGLQNSGAVDILTQAMLPKNAGRVVSLAALTGLGAALSGFMNNVGAMALLMPVAVQLSRRLDITPGQVLMPLAFGTILGGMTTLIGTPPNLIVSGFRAEAGLGQFSMFDFAPIGLAVAAAGVAFIALIGWRLVPAHRVGGTGEFETGAYMTELLVQEGSKAIGMTIAAIEAELESAGAQIVAMVRNEVRIAAPHGARHIASGDILVVEAGVGELAEILSSLGLMLEADGAAKAEAAEAKAQKKAKADAGDAPEEEQGEEKDDKPEDEEIILREVVVRPGSILVGRSAKALSMRTRYGLNLLAVSRDGQRSRSRLRTLSLRSGDLLLLQGPSHLLAAFASETGAVPLAERELRIPDRRRALLAAGIMAGAIALVAFGVLPAAVAFVLGMLASMAFGTVPPRTVYEAIDWPVVVLLAALIPVAGAMQSTGAVDLIARVLIDNFAQGNAVVGLALVLMVTMFLSDVINNAATAAVMCPIALGAAAALDVNPDSYLMAVAIGASCAFLTPIGHQNNTLILGPGGFKFGDYWRLGLPLEALVVAISLPMLLIVWPL